MAEKEYHRLTRSRRRPGISVITVARYSLWLGRDHLLCIESNGYQETYKRFYLRDIQALATRRTSARRNASIVLAAFAAALLLIGLLIGGTGAILTFGILAFTLCLVPLFINLALGPTCMCEIRTAVQTEDLPIRRVRQARKILERIRPLIAEAQGQLAPEEMQAQMQKLAGSLAAGAAGSGIAPEAAREVADDLNVPPRIVS